MSSRKLKGNKDKVAHKSGTLKAPQHHTFPPIIHFHIFIIVYSEKSNETPKISYSLDLPKGPSLQKLCAGGPTFEKQMNFITFQ